MRFSNIQEGFTLKITNLLRSGAAGILAAIMAAAALAGCGESSGAPAEGNSAGDGQLDTAAAVETTEKLYADNLPETEDLGGYTVRFLSSDKNSFEVFEDAADIVDVEVYKRSMMVEDRFNVKIEYTLDDGWGTVGETLKNSVLAGSDDTDIFGAYGYWCIGYATAGYMSNLANLPNLELDQPWWGKLFIDAMSYKGLKYWVTGDIALPYTSGMYCTIVNMNKFASRFQDDNIYQIVRDGQWTMDKMWTYVDGAYEDLNGDGQSNRGDFFGFSYSTEDPIDGLAMAAGVNFTAFDADGVPQIVITKEQTAITFGEKLTRLCTSPSSYLAASDGAYEFVRAFGEGNVLMAVSRLYNIELLLRDMADDFSIITPPKLDETQPTYRTTLHDGTTLMGIPKTVSEQGMTAATYVLEAMAADGSRNLTPVYLDVAMKSKYSRDAESAEMIDLIREHVVADFGFLYSDTGMNNFFRAYTKKGDGIASVIAKKESSWQKSLDKILTALEENAG